MDKMLLLKKTDIRFEMEDINETIANMIKLMHEWDGAQMLMEPDDLAMPELIDKTNMFCRKLSDNLDLLQMSIDDLQLIISDGEAQ